MTPAYALVAWNRKILETYSQRTVVALRAVLPLRLALPSIESFLAENIAKEVEKDGLVIHRVAEALADGRTPDDEMVRQLLEASKEIDRAFMARVADFPIGIVIRYDEIEPIRMQRIKRLQAAVNQILQAWSQTGSGRAALRANHSRSEFERLIFDLMRLYARETQALSRSLRLPALLVPLRERLAQSLYSVMNEVAVRLANEVATIVHRPAKPAVAHSLKIDSPAGKPALGLQER